MTPPSWTGTNVRAETAEREETQQFETGSPETESVFRLPVVLQLEPIFFVIVIFSANRQEAGETLQVNMCPKNPEE